MKKDAAEENRFDDIHYWYTVAALELEAILKKKIGVTELQERLKISLPLAKSVSEQIKSIRD